MTKPTPRILTPSVYLLAKDVCHRYGGVNVAWIDRRMADAVNPFPQPVRFGPRGPGVIDRRPRHWPRVDLDRYDDIVKEQAKAERAA